MRFHISLCATALCALAANAEIPTGYYDACEGKNKAALKSQLHTIVKNHTPITYGNGPDQTWGVFYLTDVHPDGYWWDIYTTNMVPVGETAPDNNTMNKEHCFPKSWWGGTNNDAYKDIIHLMPVNSVANSTRSNWPYGEVQTPKSISSKCTNPRFKHGSPKAGQGGGSATVFEPDNEFKGDLARTYFYMVTCYQDLSWSSDGLRTAENGTYPTLQPWAIEMLLRWHREDPVSQKELDRNEGVYSRQNNRNPFIDYPEMAEHIWGNKMDEPWTATGSTIEPEPTANLTSPIDNDWYHFTDVEPGRTLSRQIPVLGKGFTHNLTVKVGGESAALFKIKAGTSYLDAISINATDIESDKGYILTVVYSPVEPTVTDGFDYATLTFSSQDLETPVTVNLQGRCEAPVSLDAVTALPVENLTENGYTLHWLPCAVQPDSYTVTRRIYGTEDTPEDIFNYDVNGTETSIEITDRNPDKREVLSVKASLNGKESPAGNEIMVEATTSLQEVDTDTPATRYFNAAGYELPSRPEMPGVYVVRIGSHSSKTVIIK